MNWIFPETYGFIPRRGGGVAFDAGSANVNNIQITPPVALLVVRVKKTRSNRVIFSLCSTQNLWNPSPILKQYLLLSVNSSTEGVVSFPSVSVPKPIICA